MKLFSKFKDYNSILEEVLERKTFSSIAKSLLLSLIYKLEISYEDYKKVKVNAIDKYHYINHIIQIVDEYCDNINIVEYDSVQAKILKTNDVDAVTNSKERSILAYPTENAMFYAVLDIEPKYFWIKKDFLLKGILQKYLVDGYMQNSLEVMANFNGWSWSIDKEKSSNYIANLIYQNLISIIGEETLQDWRTDEKATVDYLNILREEIKKVTGNEDYYLTLCRLLYCISSQFEKETLQNKLKKMIKELKTLELNQAQKETLRKNIKFYTQVIKCKNSEYDELVELQKQYLIYMQKRVQNANSIDEMSKILYEIRYYQNIVFFEGVLIKNFSEIQNMLLQLQKLTIFKSCNLGTLKIITVNSEDNFDILRYILDTRIIELKEIKICIDYDDSYIYIKVYDKEILEKQGKHQFNGNKKDIALKKNKVFKLFN